jgi:SET domain
MSSFIIMTQTKKCDASIGDWNNITSHVLTPQDPPVQVRHIPGKEFGLVATRAIPQGQAVFAEQAALGAVIPMPNSYYCPSHCATCLQCMEPASSLFGEDEDALPLSHLWPHPEFCQEWKEAVERDDDEEEDILVLDKYLHDSHGRILCRHCKTLFCSTDCHTTFKSKIMNDCCRYQKLQQDLDDLVYSHDDTKSLSDYWEVLLAIRMLCRLQNDDRLVDAMKGMCGQADQLATLQVGLCLDDKKTYTVTPFYELLCDSLVLDEKVFSLEFFERLVIVCKRNAVEMYPISLFSAYETALRRACPQEASSLLAKTVRKQLATSRMDLYSMGTIRCCAVLFLFARLNHSCDPNLEIRDLGPQPAVELVALREIRPGEELSICYLSEDCQKRAAPQRNQQLESRYLFTCLCSRCVEERKIASIGSQQTI